MNAAFFDDTEVASAGVLPQSDLPRFVDVTEFRRLAVSHRRMVRFDKPEEGLRGLRDVETGEVFYTDAHRLAAK